MAEIEITESDDGEVLTLVDDEDHTFRLCLTAIVSRRGVDIDITVREKPHNVYRDSVVFELSADAAGRLGAFLLAARRLRERAAGEGS